MSDVKVYFLGEQYSVPEELKVFVGYLHYFENLHNELMPLLTNQIKEKEYSGNADEDFEYFKTPLSKSGEKVISKLAENGIYDVTLNDLVYDNKGYTQLYTVCSETIRGMIKILSDSMQSWLDGYNQAYSSAASNITGSGVSVWTSSLSSALIYSALEASTLKKQTDKADIQYRAAMSALSTKVFDRQEKAERDLLVNKYYPGVAEALGLFVSEMMEYYVTKLEQIGIFDYSKVKKFDLRRSSDLLKNISIVEDKSGLLKEAFSYCPYNPDVYNAVLINGLADIPTFETAKYFMQDGILLEVINDYANSCKDNIEAEKILVKILSMFSSEDELAVWKKVFKNEYTQLLNYYDYLNNLISKRKSLIDWLGDNITEDAVELCEMSDSAIINSATSVLNKKSISDKAIMLFIDIGIIKDSEDNKKHIDSVIEMVKKYIIELRQNVEKYRLEVDSAKRKYDCAKKNYDKKLKKLKDKETDLKSQRSSLGFFAFSKKKEIDSQLSELQKEIEELKVADETRKLQKEYERLYDILHSIYI